MKNINKLILLIVLTFIFIPSKSMAAYRYWEIYAPIPGAKLWLFPGYPWLSWAEVNTDKDQYFVNEDIVLRGTTSGKSSRISRNTGVVGLSAGPNNITICQASYFCSGVVIIKAPSYPGLYNIPLVSCYASANYCSASSISVNIIPKPLLPKPVVNIKFQ